MSILRPRGDRRGRRKKGKVVHVEHSTTIRPGRIDEYLSEGTGSSRVWTQKVTTGSIELGTVRRMNLAGSLGRVEIDSPVTEIRQAECRTDTTVGSREVVVGLKNYKTYRDSAYNRREFRVFLEDRPHIRYRQEQYRDPKTGELMEYKDGLPCLVPSPVHEIGGLQYFALGGVMESDLRFLQRKMGAMGWIESIEEIQHAPPSSGSQEHLLEFHAWRKAKAKPAKNRAYRPKVLGDSMRLNGGYLYGEGPDRTRRMKAPKDYGNELYIG